MRPVQMQQQNDSLKLILTLGIVLILLIGIVFIFLGMKNNKETNPISSKRAEASHVNVESQNNLLDEMGDVLILVRDVKVGEKIDPSMLKKERRPKNMISSSMIGDFYQIEGSFAKIDASAGDILEREQLTNKKPINTITANIPEGFRAITINVNVTSSIEGWARAGAFVDIVWNAKINDKPSAVVIVQNVKILSADRQVEANPENGQAAVPSTVTLLVLAEDATKIHLAETTGKLSLQLRGDNSEHSMASGSPLTVDDLLNGAKNDKKAEYSAVVKIKGKNGKMEKWGLKDGELVLID